ncbi:MAG TPA: ornithine carbamoyltransferase [Gaiellaceae bacterium]|nr:ornithine carbamoyltransferase [Gaiellaceae bacterium]
MAALTGRDFLRIADWARDELGELIDLADRLKDEQRRREPHLLLPGRALGLIFQKPSMRTQVSFDVGINQLGGFAVDLPPGGIGLGERESVRDVGLVLSRYLDAIVIRTFEQELVDELAEHATIPVINGLTDTAHPCQALADAMTIRERLGRWQGVRVGWVGDGNNVCASLMAICAKLGMEFVAATPEGYEPAAEVVEAARAAGGEPRLVRDPRDAATGANVLCTDVWTSMGQETERDERLRALGDYRIDSSLLAAAAADAIVLHCLPAHVGEEIDAEVLYGSQSAAWDQAENRLHAQKALLALVVA